MHTGGLNAKEAVLRHSNEMNEMNEMFKYDYINFIKEKD
jgi:hypothetical protein